MPIEYADQADQQDHLASDTVASAHHFIRFARNSNQCGFRVVYIVFEDLRQTVFSLSTMAQLVNLEFQGLSFSEAQHSLLDFQAWLLSLLPWCH